MNLLWRVIASIAIGIGVAIIALLSHEARWLERLENVSWDLRQRMLATEAPADLSIKLILIDQHSLDWASAQAPVPWPWPREFYAKIIEFCRAGGAKAIAFDLFFSEPSMFGQDDDDRFADALKQGGTIVLAVPPGPLLTSPGHWPEEIPASEFAVAGLDHWLADHPEADIALNSAVMSEEQIAASVTALGHVRADQDADSIVRRVTPIVTFDGQVLPWLGLAAHVAAGRADAREQSTMTMEGDTLVVGARRVPLDHHGQVILQYRSAALRGEHRRMYEAFSAAGIINAQLMREEGATPAIQPEVFKDCYVLIGASAPGTYDLKPTPINKAGPGVEVQAAFLDNLLHGRFMREPRPAWVWLFTIGLSLVGALAAREARGALQVALAFGFTLPVPWIVGFLAYEQGVWWPIVVPVFGLCMALVGGLMANYATEGRQRRFIKQSFQRYLSPAVIDQIIKDPSRLRLGGERRELSMFFSDLAGFSGIAEKVEAHIMADVLNDYLTVMTNIILEEQGTLDKYIGDAIVAFWNAPVDQSDHALRAVRAAARCQQALMERRDDYRRRLGADLRMRIGINTGEVSVGNFGSERRFDYTMIGHAVNLASRLEGVNKVFGTETLVADETWQRTGGAVPGREVGLVRVVGVAQPVRVHEILVNRTSLTPQAVAAFQEAIRLCQTGQAPAALSAFDRSGDDPLARRYREKLASMEPDALATWDGVWNATEK